MNDAESEGMTKPRCRAMSAQATEGAGWLRRLCSWQHMMVALLVALWWPTSAWASAPVVSNCTNYVNVGGSIEPLPLPSYTSWTGDVSSLTYTIVTNAVYGYASTWSDMSYQAGYGYLGTDSFCWCASSGGQTSGVATFVVVSTNCTPVACSGGWTGVVQTLLAIPHGILLPYIHPDIGQTLTCTITIPPTNGTACMDPSLGPYGYVDYTPKSGFVLGTDSFTWVMSDGLSTSAPALFSIILTTNHVPVANPVSCTVTSGVPAMPLFDPTTNYTDPDNGQTMRYLIASPPTNGTATIDSSSGYIDYISNPGFMGTDTFGWAVSDGMSTSTPALVTITVTPGIPVPLPQTIVMSENTPLTFTPRYSGGGGYTCWLQKNIWVNISSGGTGSGGTLTPTNVMQFYYMPKSNLVGSVYFQWSIIYSNATTPMTTTALATCSIMIKNVKTNADWTQWRFDECRTAQTPMLLPNTLYLQWRRDLPTCAGAFDAFSSSEGYTGDAYIDICRPVQLGKSLFVSCLANDSVTAYNTDTGAQIWRYYAGGALRRPPVAVALPNGTNVVIFGCDDGYVYCLNAANGSEYWKFQAAINSKKAMGFGRLSSVWPIWASPVVYSNRVYFAAGYVPTWSVWVYCLDVASGSVVWRNDGRMLKLGNHASQTSTLGPLAFSTDHSTLYGTVEGKGRVWYVSASSGELTGIAGVSDPGSGTTGHNGDNLYWYVDGSGANKRFEPLSLLAGTRSITNTDLTALGVSGTVGSMLAGDGKLFASTTSGSIYCFGSSNVVPTIYTNSVTPLPPTNDVWVSAVQSMLTNRADLAQGLALVWGVGSGRLVEELAKQATNLMIVAVDPDTNKLMRLRLEMDAAGWSGARVSTIRGYPMTCGFAPYQAALIASEDVGVAGYPPAGAGDVTDGVAFVQMLYKCTRPFGGEIWLATSNAQYTAIAGWLTAANLPTCGGASSYSVSSRTDMPVPGTDAFTQIQRLGLPDTNLVLNPPFRLIAFGPTCGGPSISPTGLKKGQKDGSYDIYSWLPETAPMAGYEPLLPSCVTESSHTDGPVPGPAVRNPLHARTENTPTLYLPNQINCLGANAYGNYTLNLGKVGYLRNASNYWGTLVLPDVGGCAGGGTLAGDGMMAYATAEACICINCFGYSQLGMIPSDDPSEEYWVNYQAGRSMKAIPETPVRTVGINFGSPGDRWDVADNVLWTHHPTFGRGSDFTMTDALPLLPVLYSGSNVTSVYHHSAQMISTSGQYHGWVASSYVKGMSGMTIPLASPLVAYRTAMPPAIDGVLNDSCWTNQTGVEMPIDLLMMNNSMGTQEVTSAGYVKLCYDDTNLYVAAGIRAPQIPLSTYVYVALNSREQRVAPVLLMHCLDNAHNTTNTPTKASTGIGTNAWTVVATTNSTPPYVYQEEMSIPWVALAAAGLWKSQLVMNVEISRSFLNVPPSTGYIPYSLPNKVNPAVANSMSPVYLDTPRGAATNATPHTVRLYFAEMEGLTNGQRVFDVQLQGQTVLTNFDVVAQAGGPKREWMKAFQNIAIANQLTISFTNNNNAPILSGVEIIDTQTNATGAHIDPPNIPPVAIITASATNGPAPLAVSFSAQNSYDSDGQIVECVWETGDNRLARGSLLNHVFAEPGVYTVNLLVLDNGGATAVTNIQVTVTTGTPAAFVCNIRSNGFAGCDYTNLTAWNTAIQSDLTSTQSLLFGVTNLGSYVSGDDGGSLVFTGGGTGILKHINFTNVAFVTGCKGLIQAGTVSNKTTHHTFAISSTGSPIFTAVAQCYNDWPGGLKDSPTITGWTVNSNHCVTIRAAAGQGHTGYLKNANGNYTGFTLKGNLDFNATPYTRIEKIAADGTGINLCSITVGSTGSVNRVLDIGLLTLRGNGMTIANSICTTLQPYQGAAASDVSLYNCTAQAFTLCDHAVYGHRAVNCLAWTNNAGFCLQSQNNPLNSIMYWLNHCVATDSTSTNYDTWLDGNAGNQGNKAVTFASAASNNFLLSATDAGARNLGVPGLGADISGNVRIGPSYDVGASQTSNSLTSYQVWELQYFGSLSNPLGQPNVDADGTGMTNYQKFIAGLNPLDPNSRFVFTGMGQNENNWGLSFSAVSGKTYTLNWCTNLLSDTWQFYTQFVATSSGTIQPVFTNSTPQAFFQLQVQ